MQDVHRSSCEKGDIVSSWASRGLDAIFSQFPLSRNLPEMLAWTTSPNPFHTDYITNNSENETIITKPNHSTERFPNYRLRYQVLKRDNFTCCVCGASPAKDPSVNLHIDHIIPVAKGGETVSENLQTLCSICNLGKSDLT